MTPTARTPESIAAIKDHAERIREADDYIAKGEARIQQVRELRNDAIRALAKDVGPSAAARISGKSLSYVTGLRR